MDEREIQQDFIDQIKGKKKVKKKSIGVYKYLVHYSFFEVITNAYPIFYQIIINNHLEKELDDSIFKFMQTKAFSPYMWKMPNEYRKFLKRTKFFKKFKYFNDLLHFEYSELFIFMQKPEKPKSSTFKITQKYKLSKNIILKQYQYDIINKIYDKKNKIYILGYYDKNLHEVVYRPLNILLFNFLRFINPKTNLKTNLKKFLKENDISYKNYKKDFRVVLQELTQQGILI